ncbi:hypothetical protein ABC345_08030 [Shouchella sp. 1P09AA]|uniref:hypothetical protein n=1 Tax=unclassified Shouchella TaxID=2893065 RepID=UPI0039A12B0A
MKRRLGFDIDGTITDPATFIPYINQDFNTNFTLDDISDYDLSNLLKMEEADFWKWMLKNEPTIYSNAPLIKKVDHILNKWNVNHDLIFITARKKQYETITLDWLKKNDIPYQHVELIGHHNKIEAVKEQDIEIFFEDKHDNAVMIAEECRIPVILFDTPYNRLPVPEQVIRVTNWTEAESWVEEWIKNKTL